MLRSARRGRAIDYGKSGAAFAETDVGEADLETTITDLMSGQYSDPVRVVTFNTAEHWAEDASEDVAREIVRRLDLAGHELPSSRSQRSSTATSVRTDN